eukprot:scaffold14030_cov121-Isochrysis_galbana.AAC.3
MQNTQPNKARARHVAREKLRQERDWGCGWGLYWPPPARPAAHPSSNTRPRASNSADVAVGHRRHAPTGILNRAPMPSPGSHRHPDIRTGARGMAAASTRRHPAHHASNTHPPASSSADALTWPSATVATCQPE